jgi:hypothetical protein
MRVRVSRLGLGLALAIVLLTLAPLARGSRPEPQASLVAGRSAPASAFATTITSKQGLGSYRPMM